jgi:hypothetical protein
MWEVIDKTVSVLANVCTIGALGFALFLFFTQRDKIASLFRLLINYGLQMSLTELSSKLDRLNSRSANDEDDKKEIVNIFSEIQGQISGNHLLSVKCSSVLTKINNLLRYPDKLTEPNKRSLIFELREELRHIDLSEYSRMAGRQG